MAVHLKDDFKDGTPLRLIKASWLNKVAGLWNWFRGGRCINVDIPDEPNEDAGPRIDLDIDQLDKELAQRGFKKDYESVRLAPNTANASNAYDDDDTDAEIAAFAPEEDVVPAMSDGSETIASAKARIGTSNCVARADHQHPVCVDIGEAENPGIGADDSSVQPSGLTLDNEEWEAGGDDGLCEMVCTRVYTTGAYRFFIFREHRYSRNGNLIYRGPEVAVVRARYS